jgi:beta-carotene 15,15'-dioxygenase
MQRADSKLTNTTALAWVIFCIATVALLATLERYWPALGLFTFVVLTLSVGLVHGASDVVLIMHDRTASIWRDSALYALCVIMCAVALTLLGAGIALLALLAMSLWHFGESPQHVVHSTYWQGIQRLCLGGASVMLPMIVSPHQLASSVMPWIGSATAWVWDVWQLSAWLWLMLSFVVVLFLVKKVGVRHLGLRRLLLELGGIALLNAMLSPLLAFAVFFGVYHSGGHLYRVLKLSEYEKRQSNTSDRRLIYVAWALAILASWGLMSLLWMFFSNSNHQSASNGLAVIVTMLASVTLPHLVLVAKHNKLLYTRSAE